MKTPAELVATWSRREQLRSGHGLARVGSDEIARLVEVREDGQAAGERQLGRAMFQRILVEPGDGRVGLHESEHTANKDKSN